MITRINASLALALTLSSASRNAYAFSSSSIQPKSAFSVSSRTHSPSPLNSHAIESEEDALWLLQKADECASSDSCSIDDAKGYLREVIHIQSGCVTGTLAGRSACEDVGFAAGVVAGLREKIEKAGERNAVGSFAFAYPGGSAILQPANPWEAPLKATLIAIACFYAASLLSNPSAYNVPVTDDFVVPFTVQEFWWALRDGYLPSMLSEYAKHGGLMQIPTLAEAEAVVPFTPQEWFWAARDGYLPDMMGEFAKHGGLMVSDADAVDQAAVLPMTAQEWMWSARDGYLGDAIKHVFRNGGL